MITVEMPFDSNVAEVRVGASALCKAPTKTKAAKIAWIGELLFKSRPRPPESRVLQLAGSVSAGVLSRA
jgi:hypothetical protein